MSEETVIDLSYLKELAGGNKEFMLEMIDIFLLQTPNYFNALGDSVNAKDFKTISEAAHKIKPTLAFMGVEKAKDIMASIELRGKLQQDYDGILADFNSLKETFQIIYVKLEEKRAELVAES
jgi:HPt (histidine-containing phosphotransfer) domain-containing protein